MAPATNTPTTAPAAAPALLTPLDPCVGLELLGPDPDVEVAEVVVKSEAAVPSEVRG